MRIALIHEWFVVLAGAENVFREISNLFPEADLFSLIEYLGTKSHHSIISSHKLTTSFLQKFPNIKNFYQKLLVFMPYAIETFDLRNYDLVISDSHLVSKGVITGPDTLHISYIHSPPRYAWDLQTQYLKEANLDKGVKGVIARLIFHYLRIWDQVAGQRPDVLVANSKYIARRIQKVYRRDSHVIYPPVDVQKFSLQTVKQDFYLTASRMVPYKRIDLIIEAFCQMPNRRLVVIGDGSEMSKIKQKARNAKNIQILGYQPFEVLKSYLENTRAFVFAAEEDFGILPVEAMACGTPVIAYGRGGVTESVVSGQTGVFFDYQDPKVIMDAIEYFEHNQFDPHLIRQQAEKFSAERFRNQFSALVDREWEKFKRSY